MKKRNIIISVILTIVSIVYTILVKTVDVKPIGPNNSNIGFSRLNDAFRSLIGSSTLIYKITEVFGLILLLLVVIYGCIGIGQLISRKKIFKVDREIIILGCLYVLMMVVYVFFEKVVINYRPILIDNELEASYPSSHTILALCVGLSSLKVSKRYFNKKYIKIINYITIRVIYFLFML